MLMPVSLPVQFPLKPKVLFTDVDETLTWEGRLPPEAFNAMVNLQKAGISVVPVTGASAGWCDCIIRTWPINSIIGENGSFYIDRDKNDRFKHTYSLSENERYSNWQRLVNLQQDVLKQFPEARKTADQAFRTTDIAFDIGQDHHVERSRATLIKQYCKLAGFSAKMSSIHINVWQGNYTKSSTALAWLNTHNIDREQSIFIGDSPNDESMFEQFPNSVGVANIIPYLSELTISPTYLTSLPGGFGFNQLSNSLLASNP